MVPSAKLAVISVIEGEDFLTENHLVFHHLLYILIVKSHHSILLSPISFHQKAFYSSSGSNFDRNLKDHMRQKADSYKTLMGLYNLLY